MTIVWSCSAPLTFLNTATFSNLSSKANSIQSSLENGIQWEELQILFKTIRTKWKFSLLGSSPQIYTVRVSVTSQKEYFFSLKICQNWNEKHKSYMPQWGKNIVVKLPPSFSWSERHWYLGHVTLTRWVFKNPLTKYFGS